MAEENQNEVISGGIEELLTDIDPRLKKQYESAKNSLEKGNPDHTIGICNSILIKNPACLDVRKLLHLAHKKANPKPNIVAQISSLINGSLFAGKASGLSKKGENAKVLEEGEKLLKANPYNVSVLNAMAKAAIAADYWSTAALCYSDIAEAKPSDTKNLLALGHAYVKSLRADEAMRIGDAILRVDAGNGDAQNLMREASVVKTMKKDNWEDTAGDFRTKVKSGQDTANVEKEGRLVTDEDNLVHMIERVKLQINDDPENVNLYREISQNLRKLKRYAEALEYVRKARELPMGKADTTLEKLESDLVLADMDASLTDLKQKVDENPDNAEIKKEFEELTLKMRSFRLANAKSMVERYPNDFNYRHIYGQLLLEDGKMDEAIAQFQLSQRNPKVRLSSLLGLGRAFLSGKKYDLAIDQLETAKKESLIMNDTKKEIIYELAHAYELMGQAEKAFHEYKEIYSSDISYKDVSSKINAYYENKNK